MRTTKGREESRVADAAGSWLFAPKTIRPAPPSDPQHAGFGLGPPAPISARAGENWALGGATGPIFWRRRPKSRLGALLGARLEMLLCACIYMHIKNSIYVVVYLHLEHLQPLAPQEALKIAPWGRTGAKHALEA